MSFPMRRVAAPAIVTLLLMLAQAAAAAPTPKESHALFGVGAQPCRTFVDVAAETNGREIALSGAIFSWAQGWFSARNIIGHEASPLTVGGSLSVEGLKELLAQECRAHPEELLYLAVNDLYERLARKGQ